ncbi:hypothetical protein D9M71_759680 [compost metagenome]
MGGVVDAEDQQHQVGRVFRHQRQQALQGTACGDAILAAGAPGHGLAQAGCEGAGQLPGQGEFQAGGADPGHGGFTYQ